MKLKITSIMVIMLMGSAIIGFSQHEHHGKMKGGGTIEDRINRHLDKMDEIVKFTGTQKTDMKSLFDAIARQKKEAFCNNEIGSDKMKDAMKTIKREKENGLKRILTTDQINLWERHKKEHKGEHNKGKHHKDVHGKGSIDDRINKRLNKIDEVVKFTGTQREQMKALMNDVFNRKRDAFCSNEIGSQGMKDAMKAIHEYKREEVKKILSADQMNLLKSKRKELKEDTDKLQRISPDDVDPVK